MAIPGFPDPENADNGQGRENDPWDAPVGTDGRAGNQADGQASEPPFDPDAGDQPSVDAPRETPQLSLGDGDVRLPWLESDDDEDEYQGGSTAQLIGLLLMGLLALAVVGGALWWFTQPRGNELVADGGVIKAPAEPYKEKPENPGGKTFDGTGDTSFAVSEGQTRPARLGLEAGPAAAPSAASIVTKPDAAAPAPADTGGVGVQIAAYSNKAAAEAGWTRLSGQYEALASQRHRIVEGKADIGTVYRLQVVTGDVASANTLCRDLKGKGLACQVKN